jgi:hypothetical protein
MPAWHKTFQWPESDKGECEAYRFEPKQCSFKCQIRHRNAKKTMWSDFFSRLRGCLTRRKRTILGIGAQVLANAFDAWSYNFLYSNNSPRSMPAKHWRLCNVVAAIVCRICMRLAASHPPFTLRFAAS